MKMIKMMFSAAVILSLGVLLGGCPATTGNIFQGVANPVSNVDIYRVKNTYAATLQLAKDWRAYCWSKPYSQVVADPIMKPVCRDRRNTVRQIQKYQPIAGLAIRKADQFVVANPTVNAAAVIGLAWDAVTDFQRVVPKVN